MALLSKARVKETASNKPSAATAFNLPGSAPTGYRSFDSAYASADTMPYYASNGTDWEEGLGTFTAGTPDTLARTVIYDSSTGSAIDWSAGADVSVGNNVSAKQFNDVYGIPFTPGGRLTLASGTPITSTDQTAKTTVYYTPYIYDRIQLWDGSSWTQTVFSETSLALGTVTSGQCYDVFAYLSSGTLALEKLAWTSTTARATNVTLQDGRLCKSGDKTRFLLGTFLTTSTTTTEDSGAKRYLCNANNDVYKTIPEIFTLNSHAYNSATIRAINNDAANARIAILCTYKTEFNATLRAKMSAGGDGYVGLKLNGTTTYDGFAVGGAAAAMSQWCQLTNNTTTTVGLNYINGVEVSYANTTFEWWGISGSVKC
jgi:hypothetical protein